MVDSVERTTFQFLEAFSNLVTKPSSAQYDWVARTGSYSIFSLLAQIVSEVRAAEIMTNHFRHETIVCHDRVFYCRMQ